VDFWFHVKLLQKQPLLPVKLFTQGFDSGMISQVDKVEPALNEHGGVRFELKKKHLRGK
jgi:hypothetical protein